MNSVTLSGSCAHNASLANNASVRPPLTRPDASPARRVGELVSQLLRRERGDTAGGKEPYPLFRQERGVGGIQRQRAARARAIAPWFLTRFICVSLVDPPQLDAIRSI
jgi:hypothetical protein